MLYRFLCICMLFSIIGSAACAELPRLVLEPHPVIKELENFNSCLRDPESNSSASNYESLVTLTRSCVPIYIREAGQRAALIAEEKYLTVDGFPISNDTKTQIYLELAYSALDSLIHEVYKDEHKDNTSIALLIIDKTSGVIGSKIREGNWKLVREELLNQGICNSKTMGMLISQSAIFISVSYRISVADLIAYHANNFEECDVKK